MLSLCRQNCSRRCRTFLHSAPQIQHSQWSELARSISQRIGKGSSHVGVYRVGHKWQVKLGINGKSKYLGRFQSEEGAAEAARDARLANPSCRDYSTKTSKYTGVFQKKGSTKYQCKIKVNGKHIFLGSFQTEEAAAKRILEAMTLYQRERTASGVYWGDDDPQIPEPAIPAAAAAAEVPAPSPAGQVAPSKESATPQGSRGNDAGNSHTLANLSSASTSRHQDGSPLGQLGRGSAGAVLGQKQDASQNKAGPSADSPPEGTGTAAGVSRSTQQSSGTVSTARQMPRQQAGRAPGVGTDQCWGHTATLQSLGCGSLLTGRRALRAEEARIVYLRVLLDSRQEELKELQAEEMDQ